jgi:F-type H+-transporting ATPase subunit c
VNNFAKVLGIAFVASILIAAPAAAQAPAERAAVSFSGAFGAGLVTIGAAYGIGRLAASAVESMSRQPEIAARVQTAMLIAAALIEGFTFFALIICLLQS